MARSAITVRALRALAAVYEEQSFSRAAEREHATQSGMSTQVKALEERLGAALLVRGRGRLDLTPAGRVVYAQGRGVLRALSEAEAAVDRLRGAAAEPVRAGVIPSLTRAALIPALEAWRAAHPGVELTLVEEYSFSLTRRVVDGALDFAAVPAGDLPEGLTARFIGRDGEVVVSRPGTLGRPHLEPVPLGALEGRRLIVPGARNVRRARIERLLKAHDVTLAERLEMDGMLATLEMVAATEWTAILPSAICHPDRDGAVRRLNPLGDPPMTSDYVIVRRAEAALPPAAEAMADALHRALSALLEDWGTLTGETGSS